VKRLISLKDIEVSEVNQTLKITVIENPHIKYIDLLNHSDKVIDDDALKQVLSSMDLTPGKIFNKRQLNKLIWVLRLPVKRLISLLVKQI
jgi:outer membrane protein insertion porin family